MMDFVLEGLEPQLLWKHFDALKDIYRDSGKEKGAAEYVIALAERLNLDYTKDETGNVVIRKPAASGKEKILPVVLQSHLDMVCVKIDIENPQIKLEKTEENGEEYLHARGTTLGADNGIGVCASLAILEEIPDPGYGPLEMLFTVNEENGMTGAKGLNEGELTGRKMINLDSENERDIIVGCAGGEEVHFYLPLRWEESRNVALKVSLQGLKGGHSGVDIHKERGNAIKLLSKLLWETNEKVSFQLASITCTNEKANRIPDEAEAVVILLEQDVKLFESWIKKGEKTIKKEYKYVEDNIEIVVIEQDLPEQVITKEDSIKVLDVLMALPHGIMRWTPENPEHKMDKLVQTSVNLAIVDTTKENTLCLVLLFRSLEETEMKTLIGRVKSIARMAGADVSEGEPDPEWPIHWKSEMLAKCETVYGDEEHFNDKYKVTAIHAGLEIGVIGRTFQDMDMVSIGPTIENPHTIDERVKISSVENFYDILKDLLEVLSNPNTSDNT
jgi:dipeptidase D